MLRRDPAKPLKHDALGSTVALTLGSGAIQKTDYYEAYGGITSSTGSSSNNRLAHTKERDFNIGLDNHGMRYYDPEVGRYITRDPIGYGDGMNVYLYVHNNPINHVDPQGLAGEGFLYAWLANKLEQAHPNNSALAFASSFASDGFRMAAGMDQTYSNAQRAQRDIQNVQNLGLKEGFKQSVSDSYEEVKEAVGTTDLVRAVDYEGKYTATERIVYAWSGLGKTFLTAFGGSQATRAMTTPKVAPPGASKPPALPKIEPPPDAPLTQQQQTAVTRINNAVADHLQPKDISGAVADQTGSPIPKGSTGGYWDHTKEVGDALRGVRKNIEKLKDVNNSAAQEAVRNGKEAVKKAEDAVKGAGI